MTPPAPDVHPNPRLSAITRPTPTKERQLRSHLEPLVPRRIADEAFLEYEVSVGERLTRTVPYMPYDDIMITIEEPWHLTTTHRHPVALIGTLTQPLKLFRQWREWFNQILADPLPLRLSSKEHLCSHLFMETKAMQLADPKQITQPAPSIWSHVMTHDQLAGKGQVTNFLENKIEESP